MKPMLRPAGVLATTILLARIAFAADEPVEPPPEAAAGADYALETRDSLEAGSVEVDFGAAGRAGGAPLRRRRVRFSDDAVQAEVREGDQDPLAGATLAGAGARGNLIAGKLAPRWGRGLVLGAASDPWKSAALDRGAGGAFRGRSGEGVSWSAGGTTGIETLGGRFDRSLLAGVRARHGPLALGVVGDRHARRQWSLAAAGGGDEAELAFDRRGRWRSELFVDRPLGTLRAGVRAGGGSEGFASLAERRRAGPARVLALSLTGDAGGGAAGLSGALWRFRPGAAGARLGLEWRRSRDEHGDLALGVAEQHGVSRPNAGKPGGFRQGAWCGWRSAPGPLVLVLRHESWGERPWARAAVRTLSTAGCEARAPFGVAITVAHSVYRTEHGEVLYLPEAASDRLVLRALAGEGTRTRLETRVPAGGGQVRAMLDLLQSAARPARVQWTLDWSRRARTRHAREGSTASE